MIRNKLIAISGIVGALAVTACDLDIPDLNNPGIDDLESHPTAISIGVAATGLLIGNRAGHGAENGFVDQQGILAREAYCFDSADPRFITELLERVLNRGSPFGGAFWAQSYANLRLSNIILHAVDKVDLPAADKKAIVGFTHTMQALDLLKVISAHDTNGAVIDTDHAVTEDLPPLADKAATLTKIAMLLDTAVAELQMAGEAFPFLLHEGYSGFDTPATFLTFNRAIRARVAVFQEDYATALTALDASFIVDGDTAPIDFDLGVYFTYTTKGGDVTNGLFTPNIYVHPSVTAAAPVGAQAGDKRLERKVGPADQQGATRGLSSDKAFKIYDKPTSPISLIRNEELILLKAEALYKQGMVPQAMTALNLVRVQSGGLTALPTPATEADFITALLYERRYSLLFEGHRLIDLRRFGRTMEIPLDKETHKRNVRHPIPLGECNARPNEMRCTLGST